MNYKDTVFLPNTSFPMRGGLPQKEPEIMERWKELDLYKKLREAGKPGYEIIPTPAIAIAASLPPETITSQ